jgi:hypothetical protein
MGSGGQITSPYTTRRHEASERGLISPQMTLQIPWMRKLGEGKDDKTVDKPNRYANRMETQKSEAR